MIDLLVGLYKESCLLGNNQDTTRIVKYEVLLLCLSPQISVIQHRTNVPLANRNIQNEAI
jgi:hypothetical protein